MKPIHSVLSISKFTKTLFILFVISTLHVVCKTNVGSKYIMH